MRILTLALMASVAIASTHAAMAGQRDKPSTPKPPLGIDSPSAAKPDYLIMHASAVGGSAKKLMVQIKNDAAVNSPAGAAVKAANMTGASPGTGVAPIPPIPAGGFVWVAVVLDKPARPGDRILVMADHNTAVAETKENNNKYGFAW